MFYDADKLKDFTAKIMQRSGLNKEDSVLFAESLVNADMRGISSHGLTRLTAYSRRLHDGLVAANVKPQILKDGCSLLLIDAKNGMGVVTAHYAMNICINRAKENGSCFAAVRGGNHFGYAAFFTEYAASKGMIGIALANGPAAMPPTGGVDPILGTNPIAISIPAMRYHPPTLDMATSIVARGKITLAKKEGRQIPADWAVDDRGLPTTDPAKVNAVLPVGGPKGYGLSLMVEIFCSCLSGALNGQKMGSFYDYNTVQQSGFFVGALNVESIMPLDDFKKEVDALIDSIKSARRAPGVSEIMIPGEIEYNNYKIAQRKGIQLSDEIIKELEALAEQYNVPFDCCHSNLNIF